MPYRLSQALEGPQDQDQGRAHGDADQKSAMEGDALQGRNFFVGHVYGLSPLAWNQARTRRRFAPSPDSRHRNPSPLPDVGQRKAVALAWRGPEARCYPASGRIWRLLALAR